MYAVVVPAYRPDGTLESLVAALTRSPASVIVIVDDGSGADYRALFDRVSLMPRVQLLRHAENSGKGAALKTAFEYVLCAYPEIAGVVTADADGQHAVDDIVKVGASLVQRGNTLILGARQFEGRNVPLRSRFGNTVTRSLVRFLVGQRLADTQTGLRGIPLSLLPALLRIPATGYDFELEMLIAAKHCSCPLHEVPIRTIYLEGNRSSHFNPLFDSMRIYFTLLRFSMLSMLSALIDNLVFLCAFFVTGSIAYSQISGRLLSVVFNYTAVRKLVFHSQQSHRVVLPRYLLLVCASGLLSYSLIRLFTSTLAMPIMGAKVLAESLVFLVNFTVQRDFIFKRRIRSSGEGPVPSGGKGAEDQVDAKTLAQ